MFAWSRRDSAIASDATHNNDSRTTGASTRVARDFINRGHCRGWSQGSAVFAGAATTHARSGYQSARSRSAMPIQSRARAGPIPA